MEVEVKLRLLDRESHDKVVALLESGKRNVYHQENYFFDGSQQELSAERCVLRCRFYNTDEKALVTLKGKMVVADGIGRASEDEEAVDPAVARAFLSDPAQLLQADLSPLRMLKGKCEVGELVCLGGFKNIRKEICWHDELLEVDETQYEWGTNFEIECETTRPEEVRQELETFLKEHGIRYKHNTTTKFANFVSHSLE